MSTYKTMFLAVLLFGVSATSYATIIYDAEASSTFTLVDAGGLLITAESTPDFSSSSSAGTGIASIDADSQSDATLFPTSPLSQSSAVSGSASSAFGTSLADSLNSFFVDIVNPTDFVLTAEFSFTYSWSISLLQGPATDAPFEAGFASAFFHLDGFAPSGSETLAIDEGLGAGIVPVADWLFNPVISFDFADLTVPGAMSGTTTVSVFVTAPEMSANRFSVITDAMGGASHVSVPVPATLSLMLIGLLSLIRPRNRTVNS